MKPFLGQVFFVDQVVGQMLGRYQWIHVNKRGVVTGVDALQSNRCAVSRRAHFRMSFSGTTHAKEQVRIAKNAILID